MWVPDLPDRDDPLPDRTAARRRHAGTVDQRNMGAHAGSMDEGPKRNQYICKGGGGTETYEPRFTYVGHRYVELHGFPGTPTAANLQQRVVHSDVEAAPTALAEQDSPRRLAGSIAFGDGGQAAVAAPAVDGPRCYQGEGCTAPRPSATAPAVLDQIAHNVRWGLIDNLHSVPEDCDQRNERWGWMADASVSAEGNFQYHWVASLYSSWLTSMRDVQTEPGARCAAAVGPAGDTNVVDGVPDCRGSVAEIVPGSTPSFLPGDPSWMFGYPLIFSYQHRYYGDARMATTLYPGLVALANYLQRTADAGKTGLVTWYKLVQKRLLDKKKEWGAHFRKLIRMPHAPWGCVIRADEQTKPNWPPLMKTLTNDYTAPRP